MARVPARFGGPEPQRRRPATRPVRMDLEPAPPELSPRIAEMQQLLEDDDGGGARLQLRAEPLHGGARRAAARARPAGRDACADAFTGTLRLNRRPLVQARSAQMASALYQIAQEAVENAVQHSGCSLIEIAVKSTRAGPCLEVRDNGRGFDPGGRTRRQPRAGAAEHGALRRAGRAGAFDQRAAGSGDQRCGPPRRRSGK